MIYQAHPDQHYGCTSYSQHGEDILIVNLFHLMGIEKPSYVDIGCHHPVNISNTYLLYERGSRGVVVDANKYVGDVFKAMRPEDRFVNVGIGPREGEMDFYSYDDFCGLNTFSKEEVKSLEGVRDVKVTRKVPVITLNRLIAEHMEGQWSDLLSVDAEGMDYAILLELPTSHRLPKVVCAETRKDVQPTFNMKSLMYDRGYHCLVRMGENLIFVHRDWQRYVR